MADRVVGAVSLQSADRFGGPVRTTDLRLRNEAHIEV